MQCRRNGARPLVSLSSHTSVPFACAGILLASIHFMLMGWHGSQQVRSWALPLGLLLWHQTACVDLTMQQLSVTNEHELCIWEMVLLAAWR